MSRLLDNVRNSTNATRRASMFNTAKDVASWLIQLIVRLSAEQHEKARRALPGKKARRADEA